jgi:hypothetical protein
MNGMNEYSTYLSIEEICRSVKTNGIWATPLRCSDISLSKSTNSRYACHVSSRKAQSDSQRNEKNEINASNRIV